MDAKDAEWAVAAGHEHAHAASDAMLTQDGRSLETGLRPQVRNDYGTFRIECETSLRVLSRRDANRADEARLPPDASPQQEGAAVPVPLQKLTNLELERRCHLLYDVCEEVVHVGARQGAAPQKGHGSLLAVPVAKGRLHYVTFDGEGHQVRNRLKEIGVVLGERAQRLREGAHDAPGLLLAVKDDADAADRAVLKLRPGDVESSLGAQVGHDDGAGRLKREAGLRGAQSAQGRVTGGAWRTSKLGAQQECGAVGDPLQD